MVYNNAIPQPTDLISNSQAQLLENFAQLDSQFGTVTGDHVAFSAVANNGYHTRIRFPSAPSAPTTTGTQSAIYPVANPTTGQQELYFQNSSTEYGGSSGRIQLTGPFTAATNGSVYLPGGIIMKWGSFVVTGSTVGVVSFPTAFPNNIFNAQATVQLTTATGGVLTGLFLGTASISPTGFNVHVQTSGSGTAYWFAIGN